MDKCFGCLYILFRKKYKEPRLQYLINHNDGEDQQLGIEFDNLVLDNPELPNYGTDVQEIGQEGEYLGKQQYDKMINRQKNTDEPISQQLFGKDLLQVDKEVHNEAKREVASLSERTLLLKEKGVLPDSNTRRSPSPNNLTLEEVEDDFENFLEEVRSRSVAFRRQYGSKPDNNISAQNSVAFFNRGGDGQSSEEDFTATENSLASNHQKNERIEWDDYTSGLIDDLPNDLNDRIPLEKRLEPIGVGYTKNIPKSNSTPSSSRGAGALTYHRDIDRMLSITDDEEDMGDFVHA